MDEPMGAEWTGSRTITIYHSAARKNEIQPAPTAGHCILYQHVLGDIKWNVHTRKLVNQSHVQFMRLQDQAKEEMLKGDSISAKSLVQYSQLYRAALHECVLGLRDSEWTSEWRSSGGESEGGIREEELGSFYAMLELAWHLCEVMFIEVLPAGCLIQQLWEWIQRNSSSEEEQLNELLTTPTPEHLDGYWRMVNRLVMRGQLRDANKLLLHHSQANTNPTAFSSMEEVLRAAPMLASTAGVPRAELHRRWADWKKEIKHRKEAGNYLAFKELQLLANVLCGEEGAFEHENILESCDSWYELMVGKLLFTNPLVTSLDYDLSYCADWSRSVWQDHDDNWQMAALDRLLEAALRNDFMEVIAISSSEINTWWFVAHLTNLLQHRGLLTQQRLESAPKLCEFLLAEYSMSLMTTQSLWQVAMDYLSHCPTHGHHYMQLLVERVPLTTERKANKILHLCQRYHLKEQTKSVCKVLAMRAYKDERLGAALTWCIRGKDSAFAAFLVEKYMESFESLGEFMDLDLLDHLGDAMLLNDKLLFLAKYREYHLLHEKKELVKAGHLLVSLLVSGSVPQRFLSTLMKDALGLLHEEILVFSSEQTYTLSHFVLQLSTCPSPMTTPPPPPTEKVEEEVMSLLRLALVKNLSRALMDESG